MNLSDEMMMLAQAWVSECLWLLSITPPPAVPAKAYLPESIANAQTFPPGGMTPPLMLIQLSPSLVDRKTIPRAPGKM